MRGKMDQFKAFVVAFLSGLAAYLDPIAGNIYSLFWVFFINFCVGYFADLNRGGRFDFKKAFRCIKEASIFFFAVASIFAIGRLNGNMNGALQCVATIVYVIFYYYGCNISRNLMQVFKPHTTGYKVVEFIYYIISIEFAKKIPYLSNYLNLENDATDTNKNSEKG